MKPRVTSFAPQFLVDDLERSIAYYQKIGFTFGDPWEGFYAIGVLEGLELHLKEAPKNDADRQYRRNNDHPDASAGVDGVEAFYELCVANDVTIIKPVTLCGMCIACGTSALLATLREKANTNGFWYHSRSAAAVGDTLTKLTAVPK